MQIFTPTKHISEEALGLHALGDLPAARSNQVAAHLSGCGRCRCELAEVQEFIMVFRMAATGRTGVSISRATH